MAVYGLLPTSRSGAGPDAGAAESSKSRSRAGTELFSCGSATNMDIYRPALSDDATTGAETNYDDVDMDIDRLALSDDATTYVLIGESLLRVEAARAGYINVLSSARAEANTAEDSAKALQPEDGAVVVDDAMDGGFLDVFLERLSNLSNFFVALRSMILAFLGTGSREVYADNPEVFEAWQQAETTYDSIPGSQYSELTLKPDPYGFMPSEFSNGPLPEPPSEQPRSQDESNGPLPEPPEPQDESYDPLPEPPDSMYSDLSLITESSGATDESGTMAPASEDAQYLDLLKQLRVGQNYGKTRTDEVYTPGPIPEENDDQDASGIDPVNSNAYLREFDTNLSDAVDPE